ncbi:MAG: hypothetical protein U9N01_03455 [Euryarchaeota archaeon]|nr:hypothetical protein [Euryarchaeota archaeon]
MTKKKDKKHWYSRWWVIILFLFIGLYFLGSLDNSDSNYQTDTSDNNYQTSNIDNVETIKEPINNDRTKYQQTISEREEETLEDYEVGKFTRDYEWEYDGYTYGLTFNLYPKVYEIFKERERTRDYDLFASDYYSKEFIKTITEGLEDYAKENDLTNAEIPYFIISFVQDLPYTSDNVTTGFDEYPRFPYETIYDDGGDCEDTAILASAMLNELGYGVALLQFPEHMAVGVKCTPSAGQSYYTYQGIDFCYLETTGENWDVGKVPPNVKSAKAIVKPLVERPALDIDFTSNYEYNAIDVYVDVKVNVKNLGSKKAENTKIYVALQTSDESKVWDSIESEDLQIEPEGVYKYSVTNLHSPTGYPFRIYVRAFGDNVISDEAVSNWVYWE